ncbi:MAG: ABC transporter ATP-binding protein [Deltaproteobacteria bacterium]|nr:ABC transporter ATP-binding protein [Deltaproteobacteria bacterium]
MKSNRNMLDVRNLRTYFYSSRGMVKAVNNVSFTIKQGEILGIAGESGAGKTVIALSVLRLVPYPGKILTGQIFFNGEDLMHKSSKEMMSIRGAGIGMIFQDPMSCLNPVFTIGEQLTASILTHQKISRQEAIEKAIEMLKIVNIPDPERRLKGFQHEFSGGMKQRVMIALALSCNPEFLIADNPTTALDSTIQLQFLNLILDLRKKLGMTILYITHDFGVVAKLCDRVAVLYAGEIIEIGSVFDVLKSPAHPYTAGLIASTPSLGMLEKKIEAIEGKQPDLAFLPPGCKFAPRCKNAAPRCLEKEVQLFEVGREGKSHLVRCLDYE